MYRDRENFCIRTAQKIEKDDTNCFKKLKETILFNETQIQVS